MNIFKQITSRLFLFKPIVIGQKLASIRFPNETRM